MIQELTFAWTYILIFKTSKYLRGNCTPDQKLACFVLYLKIVNTFLKIIYASYRQLFKELKNSTEI